MVVVVFVSREIVVVVVGRLTVKFEPSHLLSIDFELAVRWGSTIDPTILLRGFSRKQN